MNRSPHQEVCALAAVVVVFTMTAAPTLAQLGTGWTATNFTKRIHLDDDVDLQTFGWTSYKSVCTPMCADYTYTSATDTELFRIFDSRSNRSEIRLQNDYSSGMWQFEGYVKFDAPLHDESLFQIFGNTGPAATFLMMRGYRDNGGEIRVMSGSHTIASGIYGDEVRINVIHESNVSAKFYVNGEFIYEKPHNDPGVTNYWKYGVYGTTSGNVPAVVEWRQVRTFRDGLPPDIHDTPLGAYEAEYAQLNGAVVVNSQSGYTGGGFADYINSSGDYVNWTINTPEAGLYDLSFRYALQSGTRPLSIELNGQTIEPSLAFSATGNWQNWAYATIKSLYLPGGTNSIRATAIGSSGANIDHLLVEAGLAADLTRDGIVSAVDWMKFKTGQGTDFSGMTPSQSYYLGDLNGDLKHDLADFVKFRAAYETTNGTGSLAPMLAVPEPCAILLTLGALVPLMAGRRVLRAASTPHVTSSLRQNKTIWLSSALIVLVQCSLAFAAQSQWVYFDNTGKLAYQTWGNGNRIMDFSHAGYMGGGAAIPAVAGKISLNPIPNGADNTQAIQNAINAVAAMPLVNGVRGAVVLNAGTYNIANTIALNASGVVVRGAGVGQTIINQLRPAGGAGFLAFDVGGSGSRSTSGLATANMTDAYVPSGVTSFSVSSTAGFNVGDLVVVNRTVTDAWLHYLGMDALVRDGQPQTWISAGTKIPTDRIIKSITGNTITLDAPLADSFDATYVATPVGTISRYTFSSRVSQVGLENFTIQNSVPNATGNAINMDDVLDGWVRNVESKENRDAYSIGNDAKRVTWDHVSSGNSVPNTNSAAPADFAVTGTQILLNKCEQHSEGQWAYVTQARGTGPIVILNSTSSDRGVSPHQRWTTGVLTDGGDMNGSTGIEYSNRTTAGSGHGWTTGWSVAWNVATPQMKVEAAPGTQNWCIGCTGTQVSTLQPPGIYESLGMKVDLGETDSLYLEQLRERLGDKALINIGYLPSPDLNSDGQVNPADWQRFKSGQGLNFAGMTAAIAYSFGDLTGDFKHDLADFVAFRRSYIAFNGAAAFGQLLADVPEPSTISLAALVLLSLPTMAREGFGGKARVRSGR